MSTPDALSTQEENDLICEKLLGWERRKCFSPYDGRFMGYDFLDGKRETTAPAFTTWADAGLILDALLEKHREQIEELKLEINGNFDWKFVLHWDRYEKMVIGYSQDGGALAIRTAALEYIRSLP